MSRNYKSLIIILKILRKLNKEEMEFFINNLNEKNREYICEIIFNLLYNVNNLNLSKHKISKIKKNYKTNKKRFYEFSRKKCL